jgi:hypothetical protein
MFTCENCTEELQVARNCGGDYPKSRFRLQLLNRNIIYECPNTYFDGFLFELYNTYIGYKTMKSLGISSSSIDLSKLELEAYSIIESESYKASDKISETKAKKERKKNGNRRT